MSLTADIIRTQIDRMVRSKAFEASEVHRHLLQYLAEKSISGESDRLKEYVIGLEAFGKPSTYDPKHDSIVRLQIGRLRQKISDYYQNEATGDPIVVALPKGGFRLEFKESIENTAGTPNSTRWTPQRLLLILTIALAVAIGWATIATVRVVHIRHDASGAVGRWNPELESIWAPFLASDRPVLLCIGTPLFVRFPGLGFFRDPKVNDWQEIQKSGRFAGVLKSLGDKDILPSYAYTGTGEASAAILVSTLLSTRRREIALTRSNILSWEQLVDNDTVFIGPPKFNPQLQSAGLSQDLVIEPEGIRNLKPQPGEPSFVPDHMQLSKQSEGETCALISSLPGPSGVGHLMVIAGNASADTFAAAQWITEPWRATELAGHLRTKTGDFPRYYEAVIKVAFRQGIPVNSSYLLHHVHAAPRAATKH